MSLVETLEEENRNVREQEPARTTYTVAHPNGETRLQIQSYGKSDREHVGSASQTLQFTRESALQLAEIIRKTFLP